MPHNDAPPAPNATPKQPQEMRMELHVEWVNGNVSVNGPPNPILAMILISDTMKVLAQEYAKMLKESQSPIIQPGLAAVDKRIIDNAQGRKS